MTAAFNDLPSADHNGNKDSSEVQSEVDDAQPTHCTTLRTGLGVLEDTFAGGLPPGYGVCPTFVKNVPHFYILNWALPAGLCDEPLEQLYKTSSIFLQAGCIDHCHAAAVFFNDLHVRYMRELRWLRVTAAQLEALKVHCADRPVV